MSCLLTTPVDGLVTAGRYIEALALPERFVAHGPRDTASDLRVQINLAEAEYNLGRWRAAWDRLRGLDPLAAAFPIARAGLAQQRAWIATHQGNADDALRYWRRANSEMTFGCRSAHRAVYPRTPPGLRARHRIAGARTL